MYVITNIIVATGSNPSNLKITTRSNLTQWDEEKGWRSTDATRKYEEMMKLRNEHTMDTMSDKSILEKVLRRSSIYLSGWGCDPVVNEKRCAIMEQKMIEKYIMPPPSSTSSGQSEDDTSDCDTSTQTGSGQYHGENIDEFDHIE
ncbi:unnamed protein product [Lactuca virosa]|uniref:Uncharacterized protein n=1 Tax=Lactuca virosa TaxID=75947 RepID=A0AAU9NDP6_9ASTR|nr:unnamed protein product [Lactuca virosa]